MGQDIALSLVNSMLLVAAKIVAPVLLSSLFVGLAVSFVQVVTQIQEMTLTFVPKMIAIVVVVLIAGPWMLNGLVEFTQYSFLMAGAAAP